MKKLLLGVAALFTATSVFAVDPVDPAIYAPVESGGTYTITNLWMKADKNENNLNSDANLGAASEVRGMAVKDGQLLFTYRSGGLSNGIPGLKIFDMKTGNFVKEIMKDTLDFMSADGKMLGYPCNDIQVDDAGNVILFNMTTNWTTAPVALYTVDLETGALEKRFELVDPFLGVMTEGNVAGFRVDYFAIKGDITKDAILLFACSSASHVVRCDIKDGQLIKQEDDQLYKDITIQGYYPASGVDNGTGPRVVIVDDDYFYLDGFNSHATLYDKSGSIIESVGDAPEDCAATSTGNNGVAEFELGGKPFCVYSVTNNLATPPQSVKLIEMGAGPTFAGAKYYWTIPEGGLGVQSNANRVLLPRIQYEGENIVYLSVYACGSGAAAYKIEYKPEGDGVGSVANDVVAITVNGNDINFNAAADAVLYNIAGQKVAEVKDNTTMAAPAAGLYIVKAKVNGAEKVQKVVVK
ncbi:MAG: T9SS type A sorting domain-containing protein [Barnesiella sp.]